MVNDAIEDRVQGLLNDAQRTADAALARRTNLRALTDQHVVELLISGYFQGAADLPARPHMIDVGAAYGSVCRVFLRQGWSADLFEPDPNCQHQLRPLLGEFGDRCRLFPFAVASRNADHVVFHQNATPGLSGLSASPFGAAAGDLSVRCVRLGDFLPTQGVSHVEFLKIDTEGHDFDVLAGYDFAAKPPRVVFAEYSFYFAGQDQGAVVAAIADMAGRGYRAITFDYDDRGSFRQGRWDHELVRIFADGAMPSLRPTSFGNILFFRRDDARLAEVLTGLLRTLS